MKMGAAEVTLDMTASGRAVGERKSSLDILLLRLKAAKRCAMRAQKSEMSKSEC
jgi:hypothetical protein